MSDPTHFHQALPAEPNAIDYQALLNHCESLEKELISSKSQIKSMKFALMYTDTYTINKENLMRDEILSLQKALSSNLEKKKSKEKALSDELRQKSEYIESLTVKIQNLFHKSEYYKEEIVKYQRENLQIKEVLEEESLEKVKLVETVCTANEKISCLQEDFKELLQQVENEKIDKEEVTMKIIEKAHEEVHEEFEQTREIFKVEKDDFVRVENEKVAKIQEGHNKIVEELKKFAENKLNSVRKSYEERIASVIKEYNSSESLLINEINLHKARVSDLQHDLDSQCQINEFLLFKSNKLASSLQEFTSEMNKNSSIENQKFAETKMLASKALIDLEITTNQFEEAKKSIIDKYERLLKLSENAKIQECLRLQQSYTEKLKSIKEQKGEENHRKHYEIQIEILMSRIQILEEKNTELECKLRENLHTEDRERTAKLEEYKARICELENWKDEQVSHQQNLIKESFVSKYKLKILRYKEKYEKMINDTVVQNSIKLNERACVYEKMLAEAVNREKAENERIRKENDVKINELEQKIMKLRAEFRECSRVSNEKIEDLNFELQFTNKQLYQKQMEIESCKVDFKQQVQFMQSQIADLYSLLERNEKELVETREKLQKDYTNKQLELLKKHEVEKSEIISKSEERLKNLQSYYDEKLFKTKSKYKNLYEDLKSNSQSKIDSLKSKLTLTSKVARSQNLEVGKLRKHVMYMDTTLRIFSPTSSPTTRTGTQTSRAGTQTSRSRSILKPLAYSRTKLPQKAAKKLIP